MKRLKETVDGEGVEYFVHGESPRILIHSGTHGDEYESIGIVSGLIKKYLAILPDFVFVPKVSPSAVELKTRKNKRGIDLNRSFIDGSNDPEVLANIKIASLYDYQTCISFHEDPGVNYFYIYDSGLINSKKLSTLRSEISKLKVPLLTGYDDPDDAVLRNKFYKGYKRFPSVQNSDHDGTFWGWALNKGIIKNMLDPEIPGLAKKEVKTKMINLLFELILLRN